MPFTAAAMASASTRPPGRGSAVAVVQQRAEQRRAGAATPLQRWASTSEACSWRSSSARRVGLAQPLLDAPALADRAAWAGC